MDVLLGVKNGPVNGVALTVWSSRATVTCDISHDRVYDIGKLKYSRHVAITVSIPSNMTKSQVTVMASAYGTDAPEVTTERTFSVTKAKSASSSKSKASTGHSSGSGSGSGGGSGNGSSSNPAPMGNVSGSSGGAGSAGTAPQNAPSLPSIEQQQSPTTAPDPAVQQTGNSQSMRGTADAENQLTFDKLASTQAAWLAALLVAFSLLLTQVRLGKATAKDVRSKGTHRKSRRRVRRERAH